MVILLVLLVLALLFGAWTVIEGLFWLTVIIVVLALVGGFFARGALSRR
jgi:hypothetical protein